MTSLMFAKLYLTDWTNVYECIQERVSFYLGGSLSWDLRDFCDRFIDITILRKFFSSNFLQDHQIRIRICVNTDEDRSKRFKDLLFR